MNKKNKLTGQILRIAALALSISLIFGSMAIFYAAEGDEGTGSTVSDGDATPGSGSGGLVSDGDATPGSGNGGTVSGGDVTPGTGNGGTVSGGDVTPGTGNGGTVSDGDVTVSDSDVEEFVKPYKLNGEGMWDTIGIDDIKNIADGESILFNIGNSVIIKDANGRRVCTLAEAVADGATITYDAGYPETHEIDRPGVYDCKLDITQDEPAFYIYYFCLEDADLESNNKLTVKMPMTVTLADGTDVSETDTGSELAFVLWVTDGSSGGNNTTAGSTEESEATTAGSSEATTKKTTSPTKKPGNSNNTTGGNPDTSDITAANDNPGRNKAAAIMLSLGLLIAGAVAAERVYQANQEKIRRANAVRR